MSYDCYDDDFEEIDMEYLTPKEVMSLLYIGKNTFYRLVQTGELPAFRVGKQWRVHRKALFKFMTAYH